MKTVRQRANHVHLAYINKLQENQSVKRVVPAQTVLQVPRVVIKQHVLIKMELEEETLFVTLVLLSRVLQRTLIAAKPHVEQTALRTRMPHRILSKGAHRVTKLKPP